MIDIGFLPVRVWDVLDVLVVSLLLYTIYRLLKGSIAFNIVIGIVLLYVLWGIVGVLEMPLLSEILGQFISVGFIALIIIFQPEIRRFLLYLGNTTLQGRSGFLSRFFKSSFTRVRDQSISAIHNAVEYLAGTKTGALIVIPKHLNIEGYNNSGQILDAEISEDLIKSIFNKTSPLHDGAMVIHGNKIYAASCVLPVSSNPDLPKNVGLRHRAGLGASENTDTAVFVVSEETGEISFAHKGTLYRNIGSDRLATLLKKHMN